MKNGESRRIGNARIHCTIIRTSWVRREDKWMGRSAPRMSSSRTIYMVTDSAGNVVKSGIEGYRNAVKVAEGVK